MDTLIATECNLLPPIEIHNVAPFLRLSPLQGPRVLCTPADQLSYAKAIIDIRAHANYGAESGPVKERWSREAKMLLAFKGEASCGAKFKPDEEIAFRALTGRLLAYSG